jgi:hypothetical protein
MATVIKKTSRLIQHATYNLIAEAGYKRNSPDEVHLVAKKTVLDWISGGFPSNLPQNAEQMEALTREEGGHRVEVTAFDTEGVWAVRWSHPDTGWDNSPPVPGRHWTIDVGLAKGEHATSVAVRIVCSTPEEVAAPIKYTRPRIVLSLAQRVGLRQQVPLEEAAWPLKTSEDLDKLESLLCDPCRHMPVFLISEIDRKKWSFTPHPPRHMINDYKFSKMALGYAHVVTLPYRLGFEWTERVGIDWAAFDGSVRAYMPGLDFDEDDPKQHPIMFKDQIRKFSFQGKEGPEAVCNFLSDRLSAHGARRPVRWESVVFVPEARIRVADFRARHIAKLTDLSDVHARYSAQIEAVRFKLAEAEQESEQWSNEAAQAAKDREHFERENRVLRNQIDALRASLRAKTGQPVDAAVHIPGDYAGLPAWVEEHLSGRLVLHSRTSHGMKNAKYEDAGLVYRCLLLLANEYRDMRLGQITREELSQALQDLKVDLSGSIDKTRAGEEGDKYFVRYPVGSLGKEFLDSHLRKGTTKDDRYCLAIYFFWDEETRQVVVGWLPSHLPNRMT